MITLPCTHNIARSSLRAFHSRMTSIVMTLPQRIVFLVPILLLFFCKGIDTLRTVVKVWEKHKRFSEYMRQLFVMHDREARVDRTLIAEIPFSISASAIAAFRKFLRGLWKRKE